jgi:hypothetical protein
MVSLATPALMAWSEALNVGDPEIDASTGNESACYALKTGLPKWRMKPE